MRIIRYDSDPIRLLEEALKPAVPKDIELNEEEHRIHFNVIEDDLSIAIGRKGLNAKLTSRLLGWKLDIGKKEIERQKLNGPSRQIRPLEIDGPGDLPHNGSGWDVIDGSRKVGLIASSTWSQDFETKVAIGMID